MTFQDILSAISLKVKSGWTLLLIGIGIGVSQHFEIVPISDITDYLKSTSWIMIIIGGAILIVNFGSWITRIWLKAREDRKETQKIQKEKEAQNIHIIANLKTLSGNELHQLVWILRNGEKRFSLSVNRNLIGKKILQYPDFYYVGVIEVADCVWDMREKIIADTKNIHLPTEFPSSNDSWMAV
ncbi:MAG: hypothetical protein EWV41_00625 [Microcystis wesenbergii Mw_MB_S_20031200_S109]|nr:MAG: hypothetical protein EWV41_00625 [Microcystis wesenbergii Mw_MB_S_20031200_S109]